MPQTLVYTKLKYCVYGYKLFNNIVEKFYEEENRAIINSLVVQFHASQTYSVKQEIIKELSKQSPKTRVEFAFSGLSMGVHMSHVTKIIHVLLPASLEEYIQKDGRTKRSGMESYAYLCWCNSDISDFLSKRAMLQN